jgi:hypothetical protein
VRLDKGKIVEGSYEICPTHRLVSGNGVTELTDGLQLKLIETLNEIEKESSENVLEM